MIQFSQVITHGLVIGMALALLVHLVLIAIYKEVIIKEPTVPILIFEIIFMIAIMGFGIYNFIILMRR